MATHPLSGPRVGGKSRDVESPIPSALHVWEFSMPRHCLCTLSAVSIAVPCLWGSCRVAWKCQRLQKPKKYSWEYRCSTAGAYRGGRADLCNSRRLVCLMTDVVLLELPWLVMTEGVSHCEIPHLVIKEPGLSWLPKVVILSQNFLMLFLKFSSLLLDFNSLDVTH